MNNLATIKANIDAYIKANGLGEITGNGDQALRDDCFDKVYEDIYGLGYTLKGVATWGTTPGVFTEKASYLNTMSTSPQTYTGFGGIVVPQLTIGLLKWDGAAWSFSTIATMTPVVGGGDVIDDGGSSTVGNIVAENDTDGKHITDSGVPVPGLEKRGLTVASYSKIFAADIMIHKISLWAASGSPSIKIGTSAGADDISGGVIPIDALGTQFPIERYTGAGETIYYALSGSGTAYIRFDFTNKFYL